MRQAVDLEHAYIGTEHLLLGLINDGDGVGAQVLRRYGVTPESARAQVLAVLDTGQSELKGASRPAEQHPYRAGAHHALSERFRDIMRDADDVATELGFAVRLPVHVAIALVRNGEGFANAVLDRLKVDRSRLLAALISTATSEPNGLTKTLTIGQFTEVWSGVDAEAWMRRSRPMTLDILLALIDSVREVALIFEAQGIDAARVRDEARRMSG